MNYLTHKTGTDTVVGHGGVTVVYIYSLIDPRTDKIRYVGKTNNPKIRRKTHGAAKGVTPCAKWITELRKAGYKPVMNILEEVEDHEWQEAEIEWIAKLQDEGHVLLNRTKGGNGNWRTIQWTSEMRESMRQRFLGRLIPPEQRAQISKTLTGKKQSPETVAKRMASIAKRRAEAGWVKKDRESFPSRVARREGHPRKFSPEWKAKIAEGVKKHWASMSSEERERYGKQRLGVSPPNKGRKGPAQSAERRAHQSVKMKAYLAGLTPEQRQHRMDQARIAQGIWVPPTFEVLSIP